MESLEPRPCKYCGFIGARLSDEDCPVKRKRETWEGALWIFFLTALLVALLTWGVPPP